MTTTVPPTTKVPQAQEIAVLKKRCASKKEKVDRIEAELLAVEEKVKKAIVEAEGFVSRGEIMHRDAIASCEEIRASLAQWEQGEKDLEAELADVRRYIRADREALASAERRIPRSASDLEQRKAALRDIADRAGERQRLALAKDLERARRQLELVQARLRIVEEEEA